MCSITTCRRNRRTINRCYASRTFASASLASPPWVMLWTIRTEFNCYFSCIADVYLQADESYNLGWCMENICWTNFMEYYQDTNHVWQYNAIIIASKNILIGRPQFPGLFVHTCCLLQHQFISFTCVSCKISQMIGRIQNYCRQICVTLQTTLQTLKSP